MISTILTYSRPVCREVILALFSLLLLTDGYETTGRPQYPGISQENDCDIDKYCLM